MFNIYMRFQLVTSAFYSANICMHKWHACKFLVTLEGQNSVWYKSVSLVAQSSAVKLWEFWAAIPVRALTVRVFLYLMLYT